MALGSIALTAQWFSLRWRTHHCYKSVKTTLTYAINIGLKRLYSRISLFNRKTTKLMVYHVVFLGCRFAPNDPKRPALPAGPDAMCCQPAPESSLSRNSCHALDADDRAATVGGAARALLDFRSSIISD
jgi:hypothetical protein